jgi:hypothetical protein
MTKFQRITVDYINSLVETTEILTIVKPSWQDDFLVQVECGDSFTGLFKIDGSQVTACGEFEVAQDVPADVVSAIASAWGNSHNVTEFTRV